MQISEKEETNNNGHEKVSQDGIMARKRMHNPLTGLYYKLREKTTERGERGEIMGRWSSKKRRR